ncbi:MAG: hypothetical protein PHW62_00570 [Candidatus Ratteibacteria bacterium]|nr:hypothetical protein [Candidatus Ratteibacteria bacterium]
MARGNWRNWESINCAGCEAPVYKKDSKRLGGERYCQSCFNKANVKSTITSIDDLPDYVKKYARMWKNSPKAIIIVFPLPGMLTETTKATDNFTEPDVIQYEKIY